MAAATEMPAIAQKTVPSPACSEAESEDTTAGSRPAPCSGPSSRSAAPGGSVPSRRTAAERIPPRDRKSTRLNSSHLVISYAVFCLKKKKKKARRQKRHECHSLSDAPPRDNPT